MWNGRSVGRLRVEAEQNVSRALCSCACFCPRSFLCQCSSLTSCLPKIPFLPRQCRAGLGNLGTLQLWKARLIRHTILLLIRSTSRFSTLGTRSVDILSPPSLGRSQGIGAHWIGPASGKPCFWLRPSSTRLNVQRHVMPWLASPPRKQDTTNTQYKLQPTLRLPVARHVGGYCVVVEPSYQANGSSSRSGMASPVPGCCPSSPPCADIMPRSALYSVRWLSIAHISWLSLHHLTSVSLRSTVD